MIFGFLTFPLGVRLTIVAVVAGLLAAIVNWAVYALAYEPAFDSPWSRKPRRDVTFGRSDRLPIYGWWRLRRFTPQFGRSFWLRPLAVELLCVISVPCWYWWETVRGGLWLPQVPNATIDPASPLGDVVHMQFAVHLVLAMFMLAASLIDADEHNIPDAVTVPGTLLGLALLTCFPLGLLPHEFQPPRAPDWLHAFEPRDLRGVPECFGNRSLAGLITGLGCFWFWCWGLIFGGRMTSLRWNAAKYRRSMRVFFGRVAADPNVPRVVGCAVVGSVLIAMVWHYEHPRWMTLLTALIGMAAGAGIVWIVRVLGSWAFQKEAMGFGDVTLMAMIGAYLGWQPTTIVFFAAPIAALAICLPSFLFGTREMLPYGPYLCAAALAVMIGWGEIWFRMEPWFMFASWLVPAVLIGGFVVLGVVLSLLRKMQSLLGRDAG